MLCEIDGGGDTVLESDHVVLPVADMIPKFNADDLVPLVEGIKVEVKCLYLLEVPSELTPQRLTSSCVALFATVTMTLEIAPCVLPVASGATPLNQLGFDDAPSFDVRNTAGPPSLFSWSRFQRPKDGGRP